MPEERDVLPDRGTRRVQMQGDDGRWWTSDEDYDRLHAENERLREMLGRFLPDSPWVDHEPDEDCDDECDARRLLAGAIDENGESR